MNWNLLPRIRVDRLLDSILEYMEFVLSDVIDGPVVSVDNTHVEGHYIRIDSDTFTFAVLRRWSRGWFRFQKGRRRRFHQHRHDVSRTERRCWRRSRSASSTFLIPAGCCWCSRRWRRRRLRRYYLIASSRPRVDSLARCKNKNRCKQ